MHWPALGTVYPYQAIPDLRVKIQAASWWTSLGSALVTTEPPVLLTDEPIGNLDTAGTVEITEMITSFNRDRSIGIVMITHETEMASDTDRVVNLVDGEVESVGDENWRTITVGTNNQQPRNCNRSLSFFCRSRCCIRSLSRAEGGMPRDDRGASAQMSATQEGDSADVCPSC